MSESTAIATRQDFNGSESKFAVQETASTMAAAQGKAMVEARYVMAMRQPRNWDQVRLDILTECKRPTFADNKSVYYIKPIGQGVEGLGIRFVESALRHMKNVLIEPVMLFEDDTKEIQRVTVTDLESNITYSTDVRVSKTVERSKPMDDGSFISMRKNSYNKAVYTVPANDDDLLNKRGALISKAMRTLGLRIIPGDIQDEAIDIIKKIRMDDAAADPAAERKRIVDAFGEIGVKATDLTTYLGHSLDTCSPAELVSLRGVYSAIRDGEATWATVMENKAEQESSDKKPTDKKTLPTCTDESFEAKSPGWRKTILDKKKTVAELVATIQTKELLTEAQKLTIDSWSHEND
ncbi:hypothetical protein [Herminiimonas contaminans]|uniref:Uncharacterized protein n=1 Tax=Herminiimonas contaminans TaxID=1111140 RepID=A0ABS0ESJ4_9BURK|nr:hypothetical protein [Herminiimonas contaminans]MBF8177837.1 hypothetical protein [Herminiimonas contaminans]